MHLYYIFGILASFHGVAVAFAPTRQVGVSFIRTTGSDVGRPLRTRTVVFDSVEKEVGDAEQIIIEEVKEFYDDAYLVKKELAEHKPLGCTVEESLDTESDPTVVFVSKIVPGGNADKAGIRVGDVLVGVTGLFGEMTPILKAGIEKM
jgi:hypothetical protein